MGWPQYTMLALYMLGIGMEWAKHGEPKTGRHNVWTTLIATALGFGILWFGGFFA